MNRWETDRNGVRKPPTKLENDVHNHLLRACAYLITHKFPPPAEPDRLELREEREETGKVDPGLSYGRSSDGGDTSFRWLGTTACLRARILTPVRPRESLGSDGDAYTESRRVAPTSTRESIGAAEVRRVRRHALHRPGRAREPAHVQAPDRGGDLDVRAARRVARGAARCRGCHQAVRDRGRRGGLARCVLGRDRFGRRSTSSTSARCGRRSSGATRSSGHPRPRTTRRARSAAIRPIVRLAPRYPRTIDESASTTGSSCSIEQDLPGTQSASRPRSSAATSPSKRAQAGSAPRCCARCTAPGG